MQKMKLDITWSSILKVVAVLLGLWLIVELKSIIIIIIISFIIISALSPVIDLMHKRGIRRAFGVLLVYLLIFTLLGLLIFIASKPLVEATSSFINDFPRIVNDLTSKYPFIKDYYNPSTQNFGDLVKEGLQNFGNQSAQTLKAISSVLGLLTSILTVVIISIYGLTNKKGLFNKIFYLVSPKKREEVDELMLKVESQVGAWVRGQIILMIAIGLLTYIAFNIIGLGQYAAPLAIIAGLFELLPVIGPFLSGAVAVIVGLSVSPAVALFALISSVIVQFAENHILVPQIMKKAVGLDPVFTIIAILIGSHLLGIVGAILAVPLTAVGTSVFLFYYERRKSK